MKKFKQKNINKKKEKEKNKEFINRKKKLKELKKDGFNFPNNFTKKNTSKKIYLNNELINRNKLNFLNKTTKIAGRIIKKRIMGKASFLTLQDEHGEIQLYSTKNSLKSKKNNYKNFKNIDLGDIIGVKGKIFKTRTNELTIHCYKFNLLTKTLRSLPEKYHGLKNKEIRYRKRYIDFIANNHLKNIFKIRSKIIFYIRKYMNKKKFLEVETPMLHDIPGGALAKPFKTYHNSLNKKMYLRIAPELYLKRLIIGGFEKIFEINRSFRNEGISSRHNPEFTMMEIYIAYTNYKYVMKFLESLIKYLFKKIKKIKFLKNKKNNLIINKNFKILTMKESILKFNKFINKSDLNDIKKIRKIANLIKLKLKKKWKIGKILTEIFEKTVEKKLIKPTFITEYPIEVSPLARKKNNNSKFSERFEFFIGGYEIGNGFSELNDPQEQKKRFIKQIKNKNKKNINKNYDKDYILALEHGMPPTSGLGIGIDRLIMILTNQENIKDVIMFPSLSTIKK
ncbi:MAG: lysine--tRNA ligase [Buchnera aphidicola (Periphyllus lyropictus)]|uniref:lysine--tRNA ligase n=1 Tax=Buchnera aphidicola TaxID=9 RepID=UPI001EC6B7BB|nr:lysine--tRNA ligase [Buchnera aphidicola]NIH16543.1 lysine--tRNA ligase [Buchnera aphidicola (Periphyllus lyropictus)]USS94436.1 lysine--tRNA ligase [Buchnera aphidicola (Periphyllus lyropictus)]